MMDKAVHDSLVNAVNDPVSTISTRANATAYIEEFKLREDALLYLSTILLNPINEYPTQYIQIIKYFCLIVIESVSLIFRMP